MLHHLPVGLRVALPPLVHARRVVGEAVGDLMIVQHSTTEAAQRHDGGEEERRGEDEEERGGRVVETWTVNRKIDRSLDRLRRAVAQGVIVTSFGMDRSKVFSRCSDQ